MEVAKGFVCIRVFHSNSSVLDYKPRTWLKKDMTGGLGGGGCAVSGGRGRKQRLGKQEKDKSCNFLEHPPIYRALFI